MLAIAAASSAPAGAATYAKGIDVSHFNGAIGWTQVATASYRFVYAKATEGSTLIDPTYSINRAGAKGFGLRVGGYHFARPAGATDPARIANAITQADFFLSIAQPQPGELPPALDLETKNGLTQAAMQTWTSAWLGEIAARTGVSAVVYASPNFWKTALGDTPSVAGDGHRLWIAHWTTNAAPLVPGANWNGLGWTFWQWSDCATVPGFVHCTDGDRFNGSGSGRGRDPEVPRRRTGRCVAADDRRHGADRQDPRRPARHLDRRQARDLPLPVATLRCSRRELRADRRCDVGDLRTRSPTTSATRSRSPSLRRPPPDPRSRARPRPSQSSPAAPR